MVIYAPWAFKLRYFQFIDFRWSEGKIMIRWVGIYC